MNIIKIEGISDAYPEQVAGTLDWYYCMDSNNCFCDLYEAEEMVKSGMVFPGMTCHLIHYPEGTVYSPFERRENVYIEQPIWDNGWFYFLCVDFTKKKIKIFNYCTDSQKLEIEAELPLEIVEDCYNLKVVASPLMLSRAAHNGIYEIVWPKSKKIEIGPTEVLHFRNGEDLYFSEWYEDPDYHENVIVRDYNTGIIKEKFGGYMCELPNGVYWKISE